MKIVPIFANNENELAGLYSIKFDGELDDEFNKCVNNWLDIEYLDSFFVDHEADLNNGYFGKTYSILEAVTKTREEAFTLFERIFEIKDNDIESQIIIFANTFNPLIDGQLQQELQREKAKGKNNLRCLRLYAIRISPTIYLITGGAIKLVGRMDDRDHLIKEREKINIVRDFLIDNGIFGKEEFELFEI